VYVLTSRFGGGGATQPSSDKERGVEELHVHPFEGARYYN